MRFSLHTLLSVITISAVFLGGFCFARNEGCLIKTGKPLDLAIIGDGYFQIRFDNLDRTFYTRNGHFYLDANRALVAETVGERRVLFPTLYFSHGEISVIAPSGSVMAYSAGRPEDMTSSGMIQLATFNNPHGLKQVADDLYEATDESGVPMPSEPGLMGTGLLRSGYLERPPSEHWFADVKPSHVLMLAVALAAGFLLLRELRAQRRELAKLQILMSAPAPPKTY